MKLILLPKSWISIQTIHNILFTQTIFSNLYFRINYSGVHSLSHDKQHVKFSIWFNISPENVF